MKNSFVKNVKLILALLLIASISSSAVYAKVNENYNWQDKIFISKMNQERMDNNLSTLIESAELNRIAERRLADMIEHNYFAHASSTGKSYDELLASTNFDKKIRGENLAYGEFENERDVVNAWMNSKWHRYNILYQDFREVGIASAIADFKGGRYIVVVQVYGVKKNELAQIKSAQKNLVKNLAKN